MTTQVKMRFTVKETGDGKPYIIMEPKDNTPPIDVMLYLRDNADIHRATALAKELNAAIDHVSYSPY